MDTSFKYNLLHYHQLFNPEVMISYKGLFDKHIRFVFGNYFYVRMADYPEASKKIFRVFIELSQNVSYYSAEFDRSPDGEQSGIGTLVVMQDDKYYSLATGNLITNQKVEILRSKCEIINKLDRIGLREYKRDMRKQPRGVHGSANIGLIQAALISDNPLRFDFHPVDDEYSYFVVAVEIAKDQSDADDTANY